MPSPSAILNPFTSPSPGILTRSATVTSPAVIASDGNRMAESYSYGGGSNNNSSWLSGLRAKISGMSEWLAQLGVSKEEKEEKEERRKRPDEMLASSSSAGSSSYSPGEGYDDDTGFSFQSIRLDDCSTAELNPLGWMDLDSAQCWNDTLDRQHFGPLKDLLTIGGSRRGNGHAFSAVSLLHPTWCDKCGDFIWGFRQQASKCATCNYTCHERCNPVVTLDCRCLSSSLSSEEDGFYPHLDDGTLGTIPTSARIAMRTNHSTESAPCPDLPSLSSSREGTDKENQKKETSVTNPLFSSKAASATVPRSFAPTAGGSRTMKREPSAPPIEELEVREVYVKEDTPFEAAVGYKDAQLESRIAEYNRHVEHGFEIEMAPDGDCFTGCLQIHMNFTRPINIVAGERPPTVYDVVNTAKSTASLRTITSFFLPRNTVKTVALNSEMTTRQMIVVLLRKFKVADNPRKFALYECTQAVECQTLMRKFTRVPDGVCPLRSALFWQSPREKCFVLQENDAGEILWDAFEVPELQNFLRILGLEEQQYRAQIKEKFRVYESYLIAEMRGREQEGYDRDFVPAEFAPAPPTRDYDYNSTSSSMIHDDRHIYATVGDEMEDDGDFGTMRPADYATAKSVIRSSSIEEEPMYVNIRDMGDSTKL